MEAVYFLKFPKCLKLMLIYFYLLLLFFSLLILDYLFENKKLKKLFDFFNTNFKLSVTNYLSKIYRPTILLILIWFNQIN